MELRREGV
jgi:hypothetical protein